MQDLEALLRENGRYPFLFELKGPLGRVLLVGLGPNFGVLQHSSENGDPPYMMAVGSEPRVQGAYIEFMYEGTLTPIPIHHKLPRVVVEKLARQFLADGERSPEVEWEQV